MANSRRSFLKSSLALGLGAHFFEPNDAILNLKRSELEDVNWKKIAKCFHSSASDILNFNNGSCGVMPKEVINTLHKATIKLNSFAPYAIFEEWQSDNKKVMDQLGQLLGVNKGALQLVRNTTEAINLILWGIPFKKTDEIIYANWDYPFVKNTIKHLQNQKGISSKIINVNIFEATDEEIVEFYKKKISKKTKLIICTWITHSNGRILPLQEIIKVAKEYDVKVLVDAAHQIGHLPSKTKSLDIDFLATSLHKWLNGPQGTGLLYIKDRNIENHLPPLSFDENKKSDAVKYSYLGTRAFQHLKAVESAINFLLKTGVENKFNRLKSLNNDWIEECLNLKEFKLLSKVGQYGGIASFNLSNIPSSKLKKALRDEFNIHSKTIYNSISKTSGIRISPNIYHHPKDMKKLSSALQILSKRS